MKVKNIVAWSVNKFRYYAVCSKAIFFIIGLKFAYGLVENAVFSVLITHLTAAWKNSNLRKAATIVNLQEGTGSVMQLLFAFVADAYSGRFPMLICSTTLYIVGLSLAAIAARKEMHLELNVFYTALVILTLSKAATKVTLQAFLDDQLLAMCSTEEEKERAYKSSKFWSDSVSLAAAIISILVLSQSDSFLILSIASLSAMAVGFSLFLLGTKSYNCAKPIGSPLTDVASVIRTAINKRNIEYPQTPAQLLGNSSDVVEIPPRVPWLRWLDRAAVVVQENPGHVCGVEQVKGVKFLLKMVPMWTTFLTFSVVTATGSTFFLEEATNIDSDSPVLLFINMQKLASFLVAEISNFLLKKLGKRIQDNNNNGQWYQLVRIGMGMVCSVLCCIVAWRNASQWLRLVEIHTLDPEDYMSVYWLIPQYLLLGIMEGLSSDGLEEFFDSQVSESVSRYGPPFGEYVMGVGKFFSVVLIYSSRWLKSDINSSRLDKYYALLAIISFAGMIIYWLFAYWYGDERFLSDDDYEADIETGPSVRLDDINFSEKTNSEEEFLLNQESRQETEESKQQFVISESAAGDAPLLRVVRSFQRPPSSSGIHRRFNSMR